MRKTIKSLVIALLLPVVAAVSAQAAPDPAAEVAYNKLMTATIAGDYDGFMSECDATMKAALTKPMLEAVTKQIAPRLTPGYDSEYLGELKQHGFAVHLWRVRSKDGGDDFLATMSVKDGKVGGFYLH